MNKSVAETVDNDKNNALKIEMYGFPVYFKQYEWNKEFLFIACPIKMNSINNGIRGENRKKNLFDKKALDLTPYFWAYDHQ